MSTDSIYDWNSLMVQTLSDVGDLQMNGQIVTTDMINTVLLGLVGEFRSTTAPQQVALVGGVATVERIAKVNTIAIDTQGGFWIDDFNSVAWSGTGGPIAGDIYIFLLQTPTHIVTATNAGNLRVGKGSFKMNLAYSMISFVVASDDSLVEIARFPNVDSADVALASSVAYVDTTLDTLTCFTRIQNVIALGAETRSRGSIEILTATGGRVEAWVSEGGTPFMIGFYDWQLGDTAQDVADNLAAFINANSIYGAVILGGVPLVGVSAPAGRGAAANAYLLSSVVTTGITTTDVSFGGVTVGVDGTETAADIQTFAGLEDGPIYIHNAMSAAALTLIAGGNITGTLPATIVAGAYKTILKSGSNYCLPS